MSKEDRKTVMAILADNGYDVGTHTRKKANSADYYIHVALVNGTPKH